MINRLFTSKDCAYAYNVCVFHYYGRNSNYLPHSFDKLTIILNKERILPHDFFNWVFGIMERHPKYPPLPKRFDDPKLIPLFHQQRY